MPSKKGLTLRDEKLLSLAANGKSPLEISEETGVAPEKVITRIKEIIKSKDLWDDIEREKLLMHSLYDLKDRLERNFDAMVGDPKLLESYRKTLELLGNRLDTRNALNAKDFERITEAQGRRMMKVIEGGYYRARAMLAQQYPQMDLKQIDAAFALGMEEEAARLEDEYDAS